MDKIVNLIGRMFPPDKALHFVVGTLAAAFGAWVGTLFPGSVPAADAVSMAFCVGMVKEFWDASANRRARLAGLPAPHEVSFADLWYTLAGSLPVVLPLLMVQA